MLNSDWLKAFLPVGALKDGQWRALGAGFLISDGPFAWLATARHILTDIGAGDLGVFVGNIKGQLDFVNVSQAHRAAGLSWHEHSTEDLAIGLMPLSPDWDIKALGKQHFMPFADILPSLTAYTVGCPYGIPGLDPTKNTPLVLDGIISGTTSSPKRIYTSAPTFPGNSGGPLIVVKTPFNPAGGLTVGGQILFVAGIMTQSAIVPNPNDPLFPPLHLGIATPIEFLADLLNSVSAQSEMKRLLPE